MVSRRWVGAFIACAPAGHRRKDGDVGDCAQYATVASIYLTGYTNGRTQVAYVVRRDKSILGTRHLVQDDETVTLQHLDVVPRHRLVLSFTGFSNRCRL